MKKLLLLAFLIISCSSGVNDPEIIVPDPDPDPDPEPTTETFKKIVTDNYDSNSFKF